MSFDTDAVVDLVAKEHGIFLSKNDPLLSVLAMNDIVLSGYSQTLSNQLNEVKEHLEMITSRHQQQSKDLAEVIVGQTLDKIQQSGKDIEHTLHSALVEERRLHSNEMQRLLVESKTARTQSYYASAVALICVFIVVMMTIFYTNA